VRGGRLSRWALVAAITAMGAALLALVWSTKRGVDRASATLVRGEAEALRTALQSALLEPSQRPLDARTAEALAAHADAGLTYVAVIDGAGKVMSDAGTLAGPPLPNWTRTATPGVPETSGDRTRVMYRRGRPRDPPRRRDDRPGVVLEFTPRVASELRSSSRWLLVVGGLTAGTMLVLALILVRWSMRREAAVRAIAREHHLAQLGQMSAVLAHEIRNPLASLKGNAQLLAASLPEGEKSRAKADRVVSEAIRLETLSNDLLEFARAGELRLAEADPTALVREVASTVAPGRVTVIDAGAPRTWRFDPTRLRQVLVNAVENAAEMGDGAIEAEVSRAGKDLAIVVRDHGPGIAEADLPHVFEPFFTRRTDGTGLGLAVSRRLVELHGGTISLANAPGGGAILRLTLPRST